MPLNLAFLQTNQPQQFQVGMACPWRLKFLNLLEDSYVCLQTSNGCGLSLSCSGHQADSLIPGELLRVASFSKRGINRNPNVITAPRKLILKPGDWKTMCVSLVWVTRTQFTKLLSILNSFISLTYSSLQDLVPCTAETYPHQKYPKIDFAIMIPSCITN